MLSSNLNQARRLTGCFVILASLLTPRALFAEDHANLPTQDGGDTTPPSGSHADLPQPQHPAPPDRTQVTPPPGGSQGAGGSPGTSSGASVDGQLIAASGKPLVGYKVTFTPASGNGTDVDTISDPKGHFHAVGLTGGTYTIYITIPKGPNFVVPTPPEITMAANAHRQEFKLISPEGSIVTGHLIDATTGKPLKGALVAMAPPMTDTIGFSAKTDEQGGFHLRIKEGRWLLYVQRPYVRGSTAAPETIALPPTLRAADGKTYDLGTRTVKRSKT